MEYGSYGSGTESTQSGVEGGGKFSATPREWMVLGVIGLFVVLCVIAGIQALV